MLFYSGELGAFVRTFGKTFAEESGEYANTCFDVLGALGAGVKITGKATIAGAKGAKSVIRMVKAQENGFAEAIEVDDKLKNIDGFIKDTKNFEEVLDDYSKIYAEKINSNRPWSWDDDIPGGENLTKKQRVLIKRQAIDSGLIPDIKVTKAPEMRFGFADFKSAGLVKVEVDLPENMWKLSDADQFKWLDEKIGGKIEGYTWHHSEVPGKMQLVPTGIHNIITHNGGRTAGMWADSPR